MIKERIEKRINTSKRRRFGLYNNILAGIITGTAIGSIIPNFFNFPKNWIVNLFLISIFLIVGYRAGKWALRLVTKDNSENKNYKSNFIAGVFASIYTSVLILVDLITRLIILIPSSVILLIILLYFYCKRRKI